MTDNERSKLLRRFREQRSLLLRTQRDLERRPSVIVRVEKPGSHRQVVCVTREDMNIVLGQLTLLGEL